MVTMLNEFRDDPEIVDNLKEAFHQDLSRVLYTAKDSIRMDWHDLMIGEKDIQGRNILDIMKSGGFLGPDPDLISGIEDHVGRVVLGAAVNRLWQFDRAYIVMVDTPGGCENDYDRYKRGPIQHMVCLPELPNRAFWIYSIDKYHENDHFHDDQGMVRGPTGFWRFEDAGSEYFNLTLQDIVRSSHYAHVNNLVEKPGDRIDFDPTNINAELREPDKRLGKVPGVFTIPICYNPGGESISGVLDPHGQNYPCMCGNFGWKSGWSWDKDETPTFLVRSGFMFSEDFEDYCSHHNHCKGKNDIDLKDLLNSKRKKGDPEIPHQLKHPFKKCKKHRDSLKHPGWPEKDMGQEGLDAESNGMGEA